MKNKHLSFDDRLEIEKGLKENNLLRPSVTSSIKIVLLYQKRLKITLFLKTLVQLEESTLIAKKVKIVHLSKKEHSVILIIVITMKK